MLNALIIVGACVLILLIALGLVVLAVDETRKTISKIDAATKDEDYGQHRN
jgi:hypothetical protein